MPGRGPQPGLRLDHEHALHSLERGVSVARAGRRGSRRWPAIKRCTVGAWAPSRRSPSAGSASRSAAWSPTVEDGRVTQAAARSPTTRSRSGYACPKGIAMAEVQNDPDRVTAPAARARADGDVRARLLGRRRWTTSARACGAVIDEHGAESVGWYMGNPGAFSYSHTLWVKGFLDALGSPHYYSAGSQDVNNRFAASALLYGSPLVRPDPGPHAHAASCSWSGANPLVSHGSRADARRASASSCSRSSSAAAASSWSTRAAPRPRASSSTCRSGPTPTPGCCSRCCT